jgi:hypothetical protein
VGKKPCITPVKKKEEKERVTWPRSCKHAEETEMMMSSSGKNGFFTTDVTHAKMVETKNTIDVRLGIKIKF